MMNNVFWYIVIGYLILIQVVAIFLTLRDKSSAKSNKWRIKESTLLLVSVLGGSVTMLCMMRIIRHKTQHHKFMIGIPVIIVLQVVAIGAILFLL